MTHNLKRAFATLAFVIAVDTCAVYAQTPANAPFAAQDAAPAAGTEVTANLKLTGSRVLRGRVISWDLLKVQVLDASDKNVPPATLEGKWNDATAIEAWALLKRLGQAEVTRWPDVVTVLAAHPKGTAMLKQAVDLARGAGVAQSAIDEATARGAGMLRDAEEEARRAAQRALARSNPEAAPFVPMQWTPVTKLEFDANSTAQLDAAREYLARAGGSGTAYQGEYITLLTEYADEEEKGFAARVDLDAKGTIALLTESGTAPQPPGRIVIIQTREVSRYRLLLEAALGVDPAAFPGGVTAYPPAGSVVVVPPIPNATERESHIAWLTARAVLHAWSSNTRLPAWANEAIPLIVADLAVPAAKGDISWRKQGLSAIRGGSPLSQLVNSDYASAAWQSKRALSESSAYLFGRRAFEENRAAFLLWALAVKNGEEPSVAWTKYFRVAPAVSLNASNRWFMTND